jgi:hypothetical protein
MYLLHIVAFPDNATDPIRCPLGRFHNDRESTRSSLASIGSGINGRLVTPAGFVADLQAAEDEPGENRDIIQECEGVGRFAWGDTSQATYCLALACCFYLKLKWVMCRFFTEELERIPQADFRLAYDDATLQAGYEHSEDLFAQEFRDFMEKLGAKPLEE